VLISSFVFFSWSLVLSIVLSSTFSAFPIRRV
jgi:hypothetical protein